MQAEYNVGPGAAWGPGSMDSASQQGSICSLPNDVLISVLVRSAKDTRLRAADVANLCRSCKHFSFLTAPSESEDLWSEMAASFIALVTGTVPFQTATYGQLMPQGPVLLMFQTQRGATSFESLIDLQPQSEEGQADVPDVELDSPMRSSLEIYKAMSLREKCRRCGVGFHRGANFANCSVHTGVMISGHRSNGISATWTCCGSKAHAKGCTMVHHVPDLSAITSSPNSSKSSAVTPERGRGDECRPWSARGGHSPNSSVTCLDMMLGNKVVQPPVLSLGD